MEVKTSAQIPPNAGTTQSTQAPQAKPSADSGPQDRASTFTFNDPSLNAALKRVQSTPSVTSPFNFPSVGRRADTPVANTPTRTQSTQLAQVDVGKETKVGSREASVFGEPSSASISGRRRADTPVEAERPKKRMKLDFLHPLKILVGGGEHLQTFYVPQNLVTSRAKLIKDLKTDDGAAVTLADDDPTAFSIYLQCIHDDSVVVDDDETPAKDAWKLLARTYILAHKLQDTKTVNLVMDEIMSRLQNPSGNMELGKAIEFAFDNTSTESKLRKVFVDYAVSRNKDYALVQELAGAGATEFLAATLEAFMELRDKGGFAGFGRPSLTPNSFAVIPNEYHIKSAETQREG